MALTRQVISAVNADGTDLMRPAILAFHCTDRRRVSGRPLTDETNRFAAPGNRRERVFSSPKEFA